MVLCVTGPMASGKNFISSQFEKKGFAVIDADVVGHEAVEKCSAEIIKTFGKIAEEKNILLLNEDGSINRRNLGALIFGNPELIQMQENIVFPYIDSVLKDFAESHENCVLNATVLFKIESMKLCNKIIFVKASFLRRFIRAKKRDHMKTRQILARFKSQKNLFNEYKKTGIPIEIIINNGPSIFSRI